MLQSTAGRPPRANLPSPNPSGVSSFKHKPRPSDTQSTLTSHRAEGTVASGTGGPEGGASPCHLEPCIHVTRGICNFRWTVSGYVDPTKYRSVSATRANHLLTAVPGAALNQFFSPVFFYFNYNVQHLKPAHNFEQCGIRKQKRMSRVIHEYSKS